MSESTRSQKHIERGDEKGEYRRQSHLPASVRFLRASKYFFPPPRGIFHPGFLARRSLSAFFLLLPVSGYIFLGMVPLLPPTASALMNVAMLNQFLGFRLRRTSFIDSLDRTAPIIAMPPTSTLQCIYSVPLFVNHISTHPYFFSIVSTLLNSPFSTRTLSRRP